MSAKIKRAIEDTPIDHRLIDERGPTRQRLDKAEETNAKTGEVTDFYGRGDKTGTYTMRDAPIERAHAKGQITDGQYQAARKYYNHWYRAGLSASYGSADLNRVFGGENCFSGMAKTEAQAFNRARYRDAVQLLGIEASVLVEKVVCFELSLETIGNDMGWASRPQAHAAALQSLRNALDVLRKLWGIG